MNRLLLALTLIAGCGIFDEKPKPDAVSPATTTTAEPAPETPPATPANPADAVPPSADHYRAFIVLDTTADRAFFVPEDAVQSGLEGKNILYLHAYSAETPFSVTDPSGKVLGTLDIKTITDLKTGYIFAESGRPSDYLAPAAMPFVFLQASAYFGEPLRAKPSAMAGQGMGRRGKGGRMAGPNGAVGGKGTPVGAHLREHSPMKGTAGRDALGGNRPGIKAVQDGTATEKTGE